MTSTGLPATAGATRIVARTAWRRAFLNGLTAWGAAALAYALITCTVWTMRDELGPPTGEILHVWDRWDTGHYLTIAEHGYGVVPETAAFFPLYPLLMAILNPVLPGGMLAAGLIIANVFAIVALALVHRLAEDLLGSGVASRVTLYIVAYPFAFYLLAAYPHALFMTLSVGSLYLMRRGDWWAAGALAGLASGTRQAGLLLALAFAVEYLRQRRWRLRRVRWDAAAVALVPTGLLAYAGYLWRSQGDPLRFMHVQTFWGRELSWPWVGSVRAVRLLADGLSSGLILQPKVILNLIDLLAVAFTLTLLVLSLVGPWRLGPESLYLIVYGVACLVMVLLSPVGGDFPVHGTPRYVLEVLPAFLVLARLGSSRAFERLWVLPAMAVQGILVVAFFNWTFIS